MERQEAIEIVRKLADGLHPETGQSLPDDSLYQHPLEVRALQHAVDALEIQDQNRRTRNSLPPNAGKPWIEEEDARSRKNGGAKPVCRKSRSHTTEGPGRSWLKSCVCVRRRVQIRNGERRGRAGLAVLRGSVVGHVFEHGCICTAIISTSSWQSAFTRVLAASGRVAAGRSREPMRQTFAVKRSRKKLKMQSADAQIRT